MYHVVRVDDNLHQIILKNKKEIKGYSDKLFNYKPHVKDKVVNIDHGHHFVKYEQRDIKPSIAITFGFLVVSLYVVLIMMGFVLNKLEGINNYQGQTLNIVMALQSIMIIGLAISASYLTSIITRNPWFSLLGVGFCLVATIILPQSIILFAPVILLGLIGYINQKTNIKHYLESLEHINDSSNDYDEFNLN